MSSKVNLEKDTKSTTLQDDLLENHSPFNSSFTYSEDSNDLRQTIMSVDFEKEFAFSRQISLKEQISTYEPTVSSLRSSLETAEANMETIKTQAKLLEDRFSTNETNLNSLRSSTQFCSTDYSSSLKKESSLNSYKSLLFEFRQKYHHAKCIDLQRELELLVKQNELLSLKDFQMKITTIQDTEIKDYKMMIDLLTSKRETLKNLNKSLFFFIDNQYEKLDEFHFSSFIEKLREKYKKSLEIDFKLLSLNKIFNESRAEVIEYRGVQSNNINLITKRWCDISSLTPFESKTQPLKKSAKRDLKSSLSSYLALLKQSKLEADTILAKSKISHSHNLKKIFLQSRKLFASKIKLESLKHKLFIMNF